VIFYQLKFYIFFCYILCIVGAAANADIDRYVWYDVILIMKITLLKLNLAHVHELDHTVCSVPIRKCLLCIRFIIV